MRRDFNPIRLVLIFIGSIIFQISNGQENPLPGYVIKSNGDSLRGYIDYRNWEKNPDEIFFTSTDMDKKVILGPLDIVEFGVQDEIYKSAIVEVEMSAHKIGELEHDPAFQLKKDTIFLQAIILGKKNLLYLKNEVGNDNFYIRDGSNFELLKYKKYKNYVKTHEVKHIISENKKYVGQLIFYMQDCPSIQSIIHKTDYNQKSLEKLFLTYYSCSSSGNHFHKKSEKVSLKVGVLAGVSLSSLKFESHSFPYLTDSKFSGSINFSSGILFDFKLPRNLRKWSLYNELLFATYKFNEQYETFTSANNYSTTYITIGYSYFQINSMLRFKYPISNWSIYVNAGVSNGFAVDKTNHIRKESMYYSVENVEIGKAISDPKSHEQGYVLGCGVQHNRCSIEVRYEKANGISNLPSLSSISNRYFFLLGYEF